jgi:hypothetical protein
MDRDRLQALRGAVARGDGPGVVAALAEAVPPEVLQLAGDGLVLATTAGVRGAAKLSEACSTSLCDRGWPGDAELAADLDGAMGRRPAAGLQPVAVDLEELSEVLESGAGEGGGLVDLDSGEVWSLSAIEYSQESGERAPDFEAPDRWLDVPAEGSVDGYHDMEQFIEGVTDPDRADRLAIAIDGKGAFRRFKEVLARWPEDEERWYRFSDERRRGRARRWLADAGYRPAPRHPGTAG